MKKIGIDISVEKLRAAVFEEDGRISERFEESNDRTRSAVDNMDRVIDFCIAQKEGCGGIGISFPGPLDLRTGTVLNPPNMPFGWGNFRMVQYCEAKTGLKTVLNKDANAAGLAEAILGAGKGYQSVYYLSLSTGIGGGYIYKGEIVGGAHSSAAEIYDMVVNDDQHTHNGINKGSVNEQVSARGLEIISKEVFGRDVSVEELFGMAADGSDDALRILRNAEDVLGRAIANIGFVIDPDVFIVGGDMVQAYPEFVEKARERAKGYWIHPESLLVVPAVLGQDAGLLGAALLL